MTDANAERPSKTPAESTIDDISDTVADLKPHERLYRSVNGYVVRISTIRLRSDDLAALHFQITGRLAEGPSQASAPHLLIVKAEGPVALAACVDAERHLIVRRVELAAINHAAAAALVGVEDAPFGEAR
jgi:hypothetical protein